MADQPEKRTPRDVLRIVFRRRTMFLLGASLFALAALVGAPYMTPKYTGSAIVEVGVHAAAEQISGASGKAIEQVKQHLRYDLAQYGAVEEAIEELRKQPDMPASVRTLLTPAGKMQEQQLIRGLMNTIGVSWEVRAGRTGKDRVSVSFTHHEPWLAEHMPNALVTLYIDRTLDAIRNSLTEQHKFLNRKVNDAQENLAAVRDRRIEFETEHAGSMPDTPGALQDRIQNIQAEINTVRRQKAIARQKMAILEQILASALDENPAPEAAAAPEGEEAGPARVQPVEEPEGGDETVAEGDEAPSIVPPDGTRIQVVIVPNADRKRWEDNLRGYRDQLTTLRTMRHMTDKHPTIMSLKEQIADLKERIAGEPLWETKEEVYETNAALEAQRRREQAMRTEQVRMEIATIRSAVDMHQNDLDRLGARLARYEELLANFGPVRRQYEHLVQEEQERRHEVQQWKRRQADIEMALAAEIEGRATRLKDAQMAQEQFRPSSPKLTHLLGFALFGGLAFGAGLVFLSHLMDRTFTTTEDATRHLDIPVCGVIGEIVTPRERIVRQLRRWTLGPILVVLLVTALGAASLNLSLWLMKPEDYAQWTASPVAYVTEKAEEQADRAYTEVKQLWSQ